MIGSIGSAGLPTPIRKLMLCAWRPRGAASAPLCQDTERHVLLLMGDDV